MNGAILHGAILHDRIWPNSALRLFQRELCGHRPSTAVHTARRFAECIVPSQSVLEVEAPDAHIGRFTLDGNHLVCFSLQLNTVVMFDYLGPSPQPARSPDEPVGFSRFFRERWRLPLCSGSEQLSRDFAVGLRAGAFLLLASSVAARGPPAAAAADAAAAAGEAPAVAPTYVAGTNAGSAAAGPVGADDPAWDAAAPAGQLGEGQARRLPSEDLFESITFHVVDVRRGMKIDERRFSQDFFDLSGNACASLYDNTLALTSICKQTVHLLHVSSDGSLTDIQSIGRFCQADDLLPIQMATAAEQQWQLQQQEQRQQHDKQRLQASGGQQQQQQQQQQQWHQEQRLLSHGGSRPHSLPAADVAASSGAQQQQQQQYNPAGVGAAAAAAEAGGHDRPGSGAGAGMRRRRPAAAAAAAGSDDEDDEEMERRERRRRRPAAARSGAEDQHQQPQHSPQRQQQQQELASSPAELAARGGAAAAAAAAALAVLDPSRQLIQGLQQRLLTFLHRCILEGRPCDVAPTLRDLQHNFGVLSSLVVWRARLLDRQHLLLKLGAPAPGPAAAAELSASRVHFFAVYDLVATRFEGFWKGSNGQLLANIMAQPSQLLAAGHDASPWERCCAAALYPPGRPVGLGQNEQQQQPPGQSGAPVEATRQQRRGNTGGSGSSSRSVAGLPQQQLLQQEPQQQQQRQLASAHVPPAAANAAAAAAPAGASRGSSRNGAGVAASAAASAATDDSSGSKATKERLKLLRQVVLLVLPGLQSLSPSPYLDPHLFSYSKHISPIMGLRNSPAEQLVFRLARQYSCGLEPGQAGPPAARDGQRQRQPGANAEPQQAVLQLQPAVPQSVTWGSEEVARRQLHLFHPADPFVLTVVQTIAQPAVVSILYRGN